MQVHWLDDGQLNGRVTLSVQIHIKWNIRYNKSNKENKTKTSEQPYLKKNLISMPNPDASEADVVFQVKANGYNAKKDRM